ncbi:MAG: glutaminase A [Blastocatellia bacterium]|nr:glutaminase A [Blastocatellia bacterium]
MADKKSQESCEKVDLEIHSRKSTEDLDQREYRLFNALDTDAKGSITKKDLLRALQQTGLMLTDLRLQDCIRAIDSYPETISFTDFSRIIRPNILLVEQALQANFVIPEFQSFCREIERIYNQTLPIHSGDIAHYIPQLARVDPEQYGVALSTIDGQRFALGDSQVDFCIQSCCKPINYALALEEHGEEYVHNYLGREPSGRGFNELTLNHEGKPHNPMINAGAIMCCALIKQKLDMADRFDYVMERWQTLCGETKAGFSNAVYLSERATADRNFAIGYFMRENRAFPQGTDLISTLEFYFQCCSIEVNTEQMSIVAATLANGGICPTTGKRVFHPKTVQHCLSLMYSCGMYDFSGEFAFTIGLPAKSGVSGVLMVVVPNVLGLCIWSPRIDRLGNSVRGIAFCKKLVETFSFHNYESLSGLSEKIDPRRNRTSLQADNVMALIWAASKGDLTAVQRLVACGVDLNVADYDGRTPLHLAASEAHEHVVRYLLKQSVNVNPVDRWGGTPLSDAYRQGNQMIIQLLEENGGIRV